VQMELDRKELMRGILAGFQQAYDILAPAAE
jgi:hypothetical protein